MITELFDNAQVAGYVEAAKNHFDSGDHAAALEQCEKAFKLGDSSGLFYKAYVYHEYGNGYFKDSEDAVQALDSFSSALMAYDEALKKSTAKKGMVYYYRGRAKQTVAEIHAELTGDVEASISYFTQAIADFDHTLESDEAIDNALHHRAICKYRLSELRRSEFEHDEQVYPILESAISDNKQLIDTNENFEIAYYYRGLIYQEMADIQLNYFDDFDTALNILGKAARNYTKAIDRKEDDPDYFFQRADTLMRIGFIYKDFAQDPGEAATNYKQAVDDLTQAIALDEESEDIFNRRGEAYMAVSEIFYTDIGNIKQAVSSLKKAVSDFENATDIESEFEEATENLQSAQKLLKEYEG